MIKNFLRNTLLYGFALTLAGCSIAKSNMLDNNQWNTVLDNSVATDDTKSTEAAIAQAPVRKTKSAPIDSNTMGATQNTASLVDIPFKAFKASVATEQAAKRAADAKKTEEAIAQTPVRKTKSAPIDSNTMGTTQNTASLVDIQFEAFKALVATEQAAKRAANAKETEKYFFKKATASKKKRNKIAVTAVIAAEKAEEAAQKAEKAAQKVAQKAKEDFFARCYARGAIKSPVAINAKVFDESSELADKTYIATVAANANACKAKKAVSAIASSHPDIAAIIKTAKELCNL